MTWGLLIGSRAKRQLRRVPMEERDAIDTAFLEMCANPLSGDVKFLRGTDGALRRRVGAWRIFFDVDRAKRLILVTGIVRRGSHTY